MGCRKQDDGRPRCWVSTSCSSGGASASSRGRRRCWKRTSSSHGWRPWWTSWCAKKRCWKRSWQRPNGGPRPPKNAPPSSRSGSVIWAWIRTTEGVSRPVEVCRRSTPGARTQPKPGETAGIPRRHSTHPQPDPGSPILRSYRATRRPPVSNASIPPPRPGTAGPRSARSRATRGYPGSRKAPVRKRRERVTLSGGESRKPSKHRAGRSCPRSGAVTRG